MNDNNAVRSIDILDWLHKHSIQQQYYDEVRLTDDSGWPVIMISTWGTDELALENAETDVYRMVAYFDLDLHDITFDDQTHYVDIYMHLTPESRTVTR